MLTLRRATEDDQPTIRRMVLSEWLNPRNLRWQNFLIAEDDERIVGIGQIRLHGNLTPPPPLRVQRGGAIQVEDDNAAIQGTIIKELASLVVLPDYRAQGIGAALVAALEERAGRPLYLMCAPHNVGYYARLGYAEINDPRIAAAILPPRLVVWFIHQVLRSNVQVMGKIN